MDFIDPVGKVQYTICKILIFIHGKYTWIENRCGGTMYWSKWWLRGWSKYLVYFADALENMVEGLVTGENEIEAKS